MLTLDIFIRLEVSFIVVIGLSKGCLKRERAKYFWKFLGTSRKGSGYYFPGGGETDIMKIVFT